MEAVNLPINEFTVELIHRFTNQSDTSDLESKLRWIPDLTPVTTATAFQLSKGGRDVWCIDKDADYYLEVEVQDEYYPDKMKTYPEIETIFVVEGKL